MDSCNFRNILNPTRSSSTFHVPPELVEIFQSRNVNYKRYYLVLKSQQTLLKGFVDSLGKIVFLEEGNLYISTLESWANSLLNCSYGELLIITTMIMAQLNVLVQNYKGTKQTEKLIYHLLNSVIALNRLFISIETEFSKNPIKDNDNGNEKNAPKSSKINGNPLPKKPNKKQKRRSITFMNAGKEDNTSDDNENQQAKKNNEDEETIICRICDEHVRIDQFAEHTESCIQAYKYEEKIAAIHIKMVDLQNELCEHFLRETWPGEVNNACKTILPLFRASLLMERAHEIDPKDAEAAEELAYISEVIAQINVSLIKSSYSEILSQIWEQVIAKKNTSIVIRRAMDVLKNTRISGNADTTKSTQITIADFDFIKRISAGAFARVFLAKKKVSNDIYAIKVLPKDDVVQKNQVKRVVLEKDILLRFNNPYIINFCM